MTLNELVVEDLDNILEDSFLKRIDYLYGLATKSLPAYSLPNLDEEKASLLKDAENGVSYRSLVNKFVGDLLFKYWS